MTAGATGWERTAGGASGVFEPSRTRSSPSRSPRIDHEGTGAADESGRAMDSIRYYRADRECRIHRAEDRMLKRLVAGTVAAGRPPAVVAVPADAQYALDPRR